MARTAKKKVLTLEEKLEQALVPVEEQPYPVPENWVWTSINFVFDVTSSKRVHKEEWRPQGVPFYRTRELVVLSEYGVVNNELFITEELYNEFFYKYGVPRIGDILISGVGTIGIPYVVQTNDRFYFKDGNIIWFKNKRVCNPKYIFYLYKSLFMKNQIKAFSSGTTVDTYTIVNANRTLVPLPPYSEQKRIVDKIEKLVSELDQAKELAQSVLASFKERRVSMIYRGVNGELTKSWRSNRNIKRSDWNSLALHDICDRLQYGTSKKSEATGRTIVIRMGNLQLGEIVWDNLAYTNDGEDEKKYMLETGDVLFNRTNSPELVGKTSIYRGEYPAIFAGYLVRLCYKKEVVCGEYLNYVMNSDFAKDYCQTVKSDGVNQSNISAKKIGMFVVPIPSLHEQQEIVRILDSFFEKEQRAKELCEEVLDKIEHTKKSILARAFRGELGTNDPNEESSLELLKQILSEQD